MQRLQHYSQYRTVLIVHEVSLVALAPCLSGSMLSFVTLPLVVLSRSAYNDLQEIKCQCT